MIPFNLEEYLKNPLREIVTRDGRKVRIICTNVKNKYSIVAVIENRISDEEVITLTKDGKFFDDVSHEKDLFFAPKKYEGWINLYKDGGKGINIMGHYTSNPYDSEEKAIAIGKAIKNYVATIKIEWEADE